MPSSRPPSTAFVELCSRRRFGPTGDPGEAPADVLIEVPHGATRLAEYRAVRHLLQGSLPPDLEELFLVNTDAGAPELARSAAAGLAARGLRVEVLRCLLPRTLVDCNREAEGRAVAPDGQALNPAIPDYVEHPADRRRLAGLYRRYRRLSDHAHREVCGRGGVAVALHTYSPRSVSLDAFDSGIVAALRHAYRPDLYHRWPLRPEVDLICRTPGGDLLADAELVAALGRAYRGVGVEVAENGAYSLLPGTLAASRSHRWPGRLICLEVRRDLVAAPWVPFAEVAISAPAVRRLAAPLAEALAAGRPLPAPPERPTRAAR